MHSSRMCTTCSLTVSCSICWGMHASPATHAPCHTPHPLPCTPPAMHAPCHAMHPPPCMPSPCTPGHTCPQPHMPPGHTCPQAHTLPIGPCMPPCDSRYCLNQAFLCTLSIGLGSSQWVRSTDLRRLLVWWLNSPWAPGHICGVSVMLVVVVVLLFSVLVQGLTR